MAETNAASALAVPTDWERLTDKEKEAWLADRLRNVAHRTVYSWTGPWGEGDLDDDDDWEDP